MTRCDAIDGRVGSWVVLSKKCVFEVGKNSISICKKNLSQIVVYILLIFSFNYVKYDWLIIDYV